MRTAAVILLVLTTIVARRPIKEYTINLDLPPEQRYPAELIATFNSTVWGFYNHYFANDPELRDTLYGLTLKRGSEPDEMMGEIRGLAAISGLPVEFVHGVQMLYELQTLMVPVENITQPPIPAGYEALARLPHWGCTGIIATDKSGVVYHARNLDFAPVDYMTHLVYTGIFTKGGKELFRSQMVAGYVQVITAMKKGEDGFALERNTRYPDHKDGNEEMFKNLLSGRPLNGWALRKLVESSADYDTFVAAVTAQPYVSTEYAIISGVKKGTILSRDPDSVAYTQTIGKPNFEERDDYIIITNFDFFFHDIREWFDPTGGQIGAPRRIAAQELLNSTEINTLTPEFLFETINHKGVIADTIFQAIISVETGLWNVSQPDLS